MIIIILNSMLGLSGLLAFIGLVGVLTHERRRALIWDVADAADTEHLFTSSPAPDAETASTSHSWARLRDDISDSTLDIDTSAELRAWFASPSVEAKFSEAFQANARLQQEQQREAEAARAAERAVRRVNDLITGLELGENRFIAFPFSTAIVAFLLLMDVIPLNWAAQSFGLSTTVTSIFTAILVAASGGAMAGIKLTRKNPRGRAVLLALIIAAYVALISLRTQFIVTVLSVSVLTAILQAVLLNAVSAGLLVCGTMVMVRTRPPKVERAIGDVRRARRRLEMQRAARKRADYSMQEHWAVLQDMLRRWTISSGITFSVSEVDKVDALERALLDLFPR
jgi:hypothetical protein